MLTRGTAKRTGPEIDSAIEFVGGSLEAGAGRDSLTAALSVQKKDLALGLDLLSEAVLSPTFPAAEVTRKVAEIQAAIQRSEEDPGTLATRALSRLVYPGHPYGRPVEGTRESVARLTRDDPDTWVPDGFEVKVVGPSGTRQVWMRFTVETQSTTARDVVHASTLIATIRDL